MSEPASDPSVERLHPCPFCGGAAQLERQRRDGCDPALLVRCKRCPASMASPLPGLGLDEEYFLVTAWNGRSQEKKTWSNEVFAAFNEAARSYVFLLDNPPEPGLYRVAIGENAFRKVVDLAKELS